MKNNANQNSLRQTKQFKVSTEGPRLAPDLICIGAQKAGTTWLSQIFRQHPMLWNPGVKEIHFFDKLQGKKVPPEFCRNLLRSFKRKQAQGIFRTSERLLANIEKNGMNFSRYKKLYDFAPEESKTWEITPSYSSMSPDKIDFLLRKLTDTKFIYIIRDPIARAQSSLRMHIQRDFGKAEVAQADVDASARKWLEDNAMARGKYSNIIPHWHSRLDGTGRLMTVPFGRIKSDPSTLIEELEDFIAVARYTDYKGLTTPTHVTQKMELPQFAIDAITKEMAGERDYIRDELGVAFESQI